MPSLDFRALTTKSNGIARVLEVPVRVAPPLLGKNAKPTKTRDCKGVWDTGATGSAISQAVVDDLGLQPIGLTQVSTANGEATKPVYMVAILLPNHVNVDTRVTLAALMGCDVLIGMDVIGLGDFSVTNVNGRTTVSFRVPSCEVIDYVEQAKTRRASGGPSSRWERRHPGKPEPPKRRR
jgi:predicted aspartyl protease